jgi:UDP-N-acetylglucosamine transferase subunit ALG13
MGRASAVVTHGGPTSIVEARRHGHIPIVVPRRHRNGEAVDDHQARFSARLAQLQQVVLPADADDLARSLDAALSAPRAERLDDAADVARTVAHFAELVDPLLVRGARRSRRDGVRSLVDRSFAGRA